MSDETKKVLLNVEIENTEAIKKIAETKTRIAELRAEQKGLDQSTDSGRQKFEVLGQQIKALNTDSLTYQKTIQNNVKQQNEESTSLQGLKAQLSLQTAEYNKLSKEQRNDEGGKAMQKSIKGISDELKKEEAALGDNHREVANYAKGLSGLPGIFGEMADKGQSVLVKLRTQFNSVKDATMEYKDASKASKVAQEEAAVAAQLSATATKSLEAAEATGTATATMQAEAELAKATATETAAVATDAGTKSTKLLNTAMWSLVANPIGLMIAAVALVLGICYSVLKNFEPVVWAVEKGMAAVGAIFSVLKDTVLGFITGQKSLTESFTGLAGSMDNAAKNAMKLKQAQLELGEANELAAVTNSKMEAEINKLMIQSKNRSLSEKERNALIDQALAKEKVMHEGNLKRANETIQNEEKNIALKMNLNAKEQKMLAAGGYAYAQILKEKHQMDDKDMDSYKAALIAKNQVDKDSDAIVEKAMNRRDMNADKEEAKREKAIAAAEKAAEKRTADHEKAVEKELKSDQNILSLKIANQKNFNAEMLTSDTYYNDRIDMINSNWADEKKIIDKELEYKKINAQEAALKYVDAEQKKNDSIKALSQAKLNQILSNLQYEMQLNKSQNDQILAGKKRTNEEIYFSDLLQITVDQDNKIEAEKAKLKAEKTYLNEYNKQVALINQQAKTSEAQLNAAFDEKERQRKLDTQLVDLNNELELVQGNIDAEYQIKLELLEKKRTAELLAAETTGASVAMINAKYNKAEAQSDLDKFKEKFAAIKRFADAGMNVLNAGNELAKAIEAGQLQDAESANASKTKDLDDRLAKGLISQKEHDESVLKLTIDIDKKKKQIAHDQAIRDKELSIFSIIVKTAMSVMEMIAASPFTGGLPWSAIVAGLGAAQLATVIATPVPKAAKGGLVVGNSHANGGVLIEAEGGERIINKKSSSQFGGLLDGLNGIGNGAVFNPQIAMFNDGGYAARQAQNSGGITREEMKQAMIDAVKEVKVYTTIQDIRKQDVNYSKIEDRGSF